MDPYTIIVLGFIISSLKFTKVTFLDTKIHHKLYGFQALVVLEGMCPDDPFFSLCIITRHFSFYIYILQFALYASLFTITIIVPLPNFTPALLNSLLDLNLNMNLNPRPTMHDDMYNVKYQWPGTLNEPVLFKPIRQIRVSHPMFKGTRFIDFKPYLQSFNSPKKYTIG